MLVCHARSRGFEPRFPRARRKKIANIRRVSNQPQPRCAEGLFFGRWLGIHCGVLLGIHSVDLSFSPLTPSRKTKCSTAAHPGFITVVRKNIILCHDDLIHMEGQFCRRFLVEALSFLYPYGLPFRKGHPQFHLARIC